MTDRQAAEAQELSNSTFYAIVNAVTSRWSQVGSDPRGRIVDEEGLREEISRVVTREASVRLAQAEQERDENEVALEALDIRRDEEWIRAEKAEVRLREYEEALTRLVTLFFDSAPGGANPASVEHAYEQAQAVLVAASGGREAP